MFPRVFTIALATLPMLALAAPQAGGSQDGSCNVGELNCCRQMQSASAVLGGLAALLPLPLLGTNCTPISVLGAAGNNCDVQPVCCQQNYFAGLVNALNCTPVNVNL